MKTPMPGYDPTTRTLTPLTIGGVAIATPLTLAPMAGQTNAALRRLVRQYGDCGLVCTELLSSQALSRHIPQAYAMFDWHPDENPFAVQLFGADPAKMAEAARMVVDDGAAIVDINMGCWVPKIAKGGAGAALLRDLCTATAVVEAVVNAVSVPVTVKVRAGWEPENPTALQFAKSAENLGVKAIAVHARFATQGFQGTADWSWIRRVKELVTIPVIGNGDVKTAADVARMFAETGCDAVMIGRAALGRPWLFQHIAHTLRTGESLPEPTPAERLQAALEHARLTVAHTRLREDRAMVELRGQIGKYGFGIPGAGALRDRLVQVSSLADVEAILLPAIERAQDYAAQGAPASP